MSRPVETADFLVPIPSLNRVVAGRFRLEQEAGSGGMGTV